MQYRLFDGNTPIHGELTSIDFFKFLFSKFPDRTQPSSAIITQSKPEAPIFWLLESQYIIVHYVNTWAYWGGRWGGRWEGRRRKRERGEGDFLNWNSKDKWIVQIQSLSIYYTPAHRSGQFPSFIFSPFCDSFRKNLRVFSLKIFSIGKIFLLISVYQRTVLESNARIPFISLILSSLHYCARIKCTWTFSVLYIKSVQQYILQNI